MPTAWGSDQPQRHRDTHAIPTRAHPAQREATQRRLNLTMADDMAHGMLPAPLRFARTITDEIAHAIPWRWQRPQRGGGHIRQYLSASSSREI